MKCKNCDGNVPIVDKEKILCQLCFNHFNQEDFKPDNIKPILPEDPKERKQIPVYSGCLAYFPDALIEVAKLSQAGNDQHNPGQPLHWDRSKSGDELDALIRHLLEGDWAAVAWRALAHCQKELEKARGIK